MHEIGGWRLPDASDEPRSERRPGKVTRPGQLLPGLTRLQTSRIWPKEDGSPTPAYRLLDLYFADYAAASAAAAEAGPLVAATLKQATGGVVIAFAEVLEDA